MLQLLRCLELGKKLSLRQAPTQYNVPKRTLARRTSGKKKIVVGSKKHLGRYATDLSPEFEVALKEHILDMEGRFFGLTCQEVRMLAFELAQRNGIQHQFSVEKQMAEKKWLSGFL